MITRGRQTCQPSPADQITQGVVSTLWVQLGPAVKHTSPEVKGHEGCLGEMPLGAHLSFIYNEVRHTHSLPGKQSACNLGTASRYKQ